jgi:hypothetical protein
VVIRRLVCRVRGHRPVLVFDAVEPFGGSTIAGSLAFRVTASHRYCRRCRKDPL